MKAGAQPTYDAGVTPSEITAAIDAELAELDDPRITALVRSLAIEPTPIVLDWDYGPEVYEGWLLLRERSSNTAIVFHAGGFGPIPTLRWGLVFEPDEHGRSSMGMDSGWFRTFTETLLESVIATQIDIWRVVRRAKNGADPGEPITPEASWDATWAEVSRRRSSDPTSRYDCQCDAEQRWARRNLGLRAHE